MSPRLAFNGRHVMQLGAQRGVREQRSRIRSVTVSCHLCIDFLQWNGHVKSRFAFTTELDTSHPRFSLRYVVRWPPQPAAVADAHDKLLQSESKRFHVLFARGEHRDRYFIPLRTSSAVLLSKLCHQQSRRVSRASRWSPSRHATPGRASGTQAFGQALVAQLESRSSFQKVSKSVPSCATA